MNLLLMLLQLTLVAMLIAPASAAHLGLSCQRRILVISGSMRALQATLASNIWINANIASNCQLTVLLLVFLYLAI